MFPRISVSIFSIYINDKQSYEESLYCKTGPVSLWFTKSCSNKSLRFQNYQQDCGKVKISELLNTSQVWIT